MSLPDRWDVIIAGAGPAGVSTALHLAQLDPGLVERTLILEKARHPRHKLCGGGLLPDAELVLQHLGLDLHEVPSCEVDWARFDYAGKGFRMRARRGDRIAFRTVRRHEFDAWLAGKARDKGFRILEDTAVRSVSVGNEEVRVETDAGTFLSKVLVGADGSKSVVRRAVAPNEPTHTARLLEILTEPRPGSSFHIQSDSYFDFLYLPQGILGYSWDFPALEGGKPVRNRGIYDSNVYPLEASIALADALKDELARHGYDMADYKLEGHPLRWFEPNSRFSVPHILLVGDAAGGDALFGEGISIALGYGALAAKAVRQAFEGQDFSFSGYKQAILRSELGKALSRRTFMAKFYYRLRSPFIQKVVWRRLGWLVEPVMQRFMIGWVFRQERKEDRKQKARIQ